MEPHVHHWIPLSPSDETGVAYACYEPGCPERSKWVPSPLCQCPPNERGSWPAETSSSCQKRIERA